VIKTHSQQVEKEKRQFSAGGREKGGGGKEIFIEKWKTQTRRDEKKVNELRAITSGE